MDKNKQPDQSPIQTNKLIETQWKAYAKQVLPLHASEDMVITVQTTFWTGALVVFKLLKIHPLEIIEKELEEYLLKLKKIN